MKEFIKKKVNFFLLLIVVILLLGFVGVSTVYQIEFKQLNKEAEIVNENYSVCSQNLEYYTSELESTKQKLNTSVKDVESFGDIYQEKSEEVAVKDLEIDKLKSKVSKAENDAKVYKKNYLDTKALLDAANINLDTCQQEKLGFEQDIDNLENELDNCKEDLANCNGT